jgi:hypothetical protein
MQVPWQSRWPVVHLQLPLEHAKPAAQGPPVVPQVQLPVLSQVSVRPVQAAAPPHLQVPPVAQLLTFLALQSPPVLPHTQAPVEEQVSAVVALHAMH